MSAPARIQLRRTGGWRKPDGAIVVSRPHHWGNPFKVGEPINRHTQLLVRDAAHAVKLYRQLIERNPSSLAAIRGELAGHDLACWCPLDQPCHADVLLELANEQEAGR